MSMNDKIDMMLRENETIVRNFIDRNIKDEHHGEFVIDKLDSMFSVFAEKLLRELAGELNGWTKRMDDAMRIPDVVNELADRIKHRSLMS